MAGRDDEDSRAADAGFISVARLAGAHGVRGDVRLIPFTEVPADIFRLPLVVGKNFDPVTVKKKGSLKDGFIVRVSGIDSREEAERAKNQRLFVAREALGDAGGDAGDPGEGDTYFLADLIGLSVVDAATGAALGTVRAVENYGAEDLLELALDKPIKGFGRIVLLPFRRALVPGVDLKAGSVSVDLAAWTGVHIGADVQERDRADSADAAAVKPGG